MAHKKKGNLITSGEWAKHLRKELKRNFWKGERKAEKQMISHELHRDNIVNKINENDMKHEVWQDKEGKTMLCFAGKLGNEARELLELDSKLVHTFYAESHYEAMNKYYEYMGWGNYETKFEVDKEPYKFNS